MEKTVAIIGAGRVGCSIGFLLRQAGYTITAVAARTQASAESARAFIGAGEAFVDAAQAARSAEVIFITTPDGAIREVCDRTAAVRGFQAGSLVAHTSGAHTLDLIDAARFAGAYRAVLHPLQSVPSREQGVKNLPGSYFRIEADPQASDRARVLVQALGGIELAMPKWKSDPDSAALYHAGAVAVSNYFVALIDYGLKFYQSLGADKQEALKAVLPLVKGTLANIETLGIPAALTGPIMRGDVETVRGHLAAMKRVAPQQLDLYRELAITTIALASERGLADEKKEELLHLLIIED